MNVCRNSECQTTAGCAHRGPLGQYCWFGFGTGTVGKPREPHKTMTMEEYIAAGLKDWHEVCFNVDGFGNVGVRYLSQ